MNGWGTRYTGTGPELQRELGRLDGPNMAIPQGKQYCEHGQHYVKRPGYVTHKGWVCDACRAELKDAA